MGLLSNIIKLFLGLAIIVLGVWLLVIFWSPFVELLKAIVGPVIIIIGLILTMISYFGLRG
jgi:hypothetical protein